MYFADDVRISQASNSQREFTYMHTLNTQLILSFGEVILLGFLAMTLHEAGHWLAALAVGVRVKAVGLCWKGLYTVRESGSPAKNFIISLAGPFANIVLMILWGHFFSQFSMANMCFAVCNLVPIRGSDGDRALTCWRQIQRDSASAR
jgi:Zn-dependent protease